MNPHNHDQESPPTSRPQPRWLDSVIPESSLGSALVGALLCVVTGIPLVLISVHGLELYGFTIFVGLPFAVGLIPTVVYTYHRRRGFWACVGVSLMAVGMLGSTIFFFAIEGLVCLLMAAPLVLVEVFVGALIGFALQGVLHDGRRGEHVLLVLLVSLPLLMGFEHLSEDQPPLIPVATTIEVDAPAAVVWEHVVTFSELPEPVDPVFRIGIAYPTDATIEGEGVGAVRHCNFTTGSFVEPITVWDEPNRLAFDVTAHPPAMEEWSLYDEIDAPHVDGFFESERGEFTLEALPDGRTRLTGTTWYRHRIWPVAYWQVFSDEIIHRIHLRVLRHIQQTAEAA
jgi:hypothetical protein